MLAGLGGNVPSIQGDGSYVFVSADTGSSKDGYDDIGEAFDGGDSLTTPAVQDHSRATGLHMHGCPGLCLDNEAACDSRLFRDSEC